MTMPRPELHAKVRDFAARMKGARAARGLSQKALAERAAVSTGSIGELETGIGLPGIGTCAQLADALEVSPAWLAFGIGRGPAIDAKDP